MDSKEKLDSNAVFDLEDDDILKSAAISGGRFKLYTSNSSDCPSLSPQRQHGVHNADARSKFKMICRRFEFLCRVIVPAVEKHSLSLNGAGGRNDTVAGRSMKKMPTYIVTLACTSKRKIPTYIYDGLYNVVDFCEEGEPGSRMFKYTLKKISGQPKLPLHFADPDDEAQTAHG